METADIQWRRASDLRAGVGGQQGITWPTFYKWELMKQEDGSWMCDQMVPRNPAEVEAPTDAAPLLASE